jgi:hypothetical protein
MEKRAGRGAAACSTRLALLSVVAALERRRRRNFLMSVEEPLDYGDRQKKNMLQGLCSCWLSRRGVVSGDGATLTESGIPGRFRYVGVCGRTGPLDAPHHVDAND